MLTVDRRVVASRPRTPDPKKWNLHTGRILKKILPLDLGLAEIRDFFDALVRSPMRLTGAARAHYAQH